MAKKSEMTFGQSIRDNQTVTVTEAHMRYRQDSYEIASSTTWDHKTEFVRSQSQGHQLVFPEHEAVVINIHRK